MKIEVKSKKSHRNYTDTWKQNNALFLKMGALSTSMSVEYMCSWSLRKPEEGFGSLLIGVYHVGAGN